MGSYKMIFDDGNEVYKLESGSLEDAALEALELVGCRIVVKKDTEPSGEELEEINELKGRLAKISSQLAFFIRETEALINYSKKCLDQYGWNEKE